MSEPARSPRWAWWLCGLLTAAAWATFGWGLARYPLPYVDEAFFNLPAIHWLHGDGFWYLARSDAPFGRTAWAYHGPLYPHLQILTFRLLGVSEAAARLPQYVAAHLGLLVLLVTLLRRGRHRAAVLLAVVWFGDRPLMEIMYGRMEGLALLFLAGLFAAVLSAGERRSPALAALAGLCGGLAGITHPTTAVFWLAAFVLLGCGERRLLYGYVLGTLPAAALLVYWWWPLSAALVQFRWHLHLSAGGSWGHWVVECLTVLRWSRWWVMALLAVWAVVVPATALRRRGDWPLVVVTAFATAGLLAILKKPIYPYYLVYYTVWPVIGLGLVLTGEDARKWRWAWAVLVLAWLPALAWNGLRWRELVIHYSDLDRARARQCLAEHVPPTVPVTGSPEFYLLAPEAGLRFEPLPWFDRTAMPPADTWLLLTEADYEQHYRVPPAEQAARPIVYKGPALAPTRHLSWPIVILGPRR